MPPNVSVSFKNVTARWVLPTNMPQSKNDPSAKGSVEGNGKSAPRPATLESLNADLPAGMLVGIIGPVGAGKSSLLQAVLRELPLESGSINQSGTISYASQEPWIFAGTVRQNVLFGRAYDKERYDAVIKACALVKDFKQLANGDRTLIGERGASLSGGQKARVKYAGPAFAIHRQLIAVLCNFAICLIDFSLARAVYRQADIYLLDDPLSAVDGHVGTHIFSKCLGTHGFLAQSKATRILVTHQIHLLKKADWLIVLQDVTDLRFPYAGLATQAKATLIFTFRRAKLVLKDRRPIWRTSALIW